MCHTLLSYEFLDNGEVYFDPNCGCVNYSVPLIKASWEDVRNNYNVLRDKIETQRIWKFYE